MTNDQMQIMVLVLLGVNMLFWIIILLQSLAKFKREKRNYGKHKNI